MKSGIINKRICFLIAGAALIVVLILVGIFYVPQTPRYSLYQLKKALVAKDIDAVSRYADVEMIVAKLADRVFEKTEKKLQADDKGTKRSRGNEILRELIPQIKKDMSRRAKGQLLEFLEDKKIQENLRKSTIWMVRIQEDGDTAKAFIGGKERFRMARTPEGSWKITDIYFDTRKEPTGAQ